MKYLVMEVHPGWAVLLGADGRFIKAVNLNYSVGDTVYDILPMRDFRTRRQLIKRALIRLFVLICAVALVLLLRFMLFTTTSAVLLDLDGEVLIKLNRLDYVIGLEAHDSEGGLLINGVGSFGARVGDISAQLIERALQLGYLDEDDKAELEIYSDDKAHRNKIIGELYEQLGERFGESVELEIEDGDELENIF